MAERIVREDKWSVLVDGRRITCTAEQEWRLRSLTPEELTNFVKVMGGGEGSWENITERAGGEES